MPGGARKQPGRWQTGQEMRETLLPVFLIGACISRPPSRPQPTPSAPSPIGLAASRAAGAGLLRWPSTRQLLCLATCGRLAPPTCCTSAWRRAQRGGAAPDVACARRRRSPPPSAAARPQSVLRLPPLPLRPFQPRRAPHQPGQPQRPVPSTRRRRWHVCERAAQVRAAAACTARVGWSVVCRPSKPSAAC